MSASNGIYETTWGTVIGDVGAGVVSGVGCEPVEGFERRPSLFSRFIS